MSTPTLPALTLDGFITNKQKIMTKLFEYFRASEKSQSTTFYKECCSLKYILEQHRDSYATRDDLVAELTKLYTPYFASVDVNVDIDESADTTLIKYNVYITAIDEDNKPYTLESSLDDTINIANSYNGILDKTYNKHE